MHKIHIAALINDGNLGDGWHDNYAAAQALAESTERTWRADVRPLAEEGYDVTITVEVARNAQGVGGGRVGVAAWPYDECSEELELRTEQLLTPPQVIWERFCASPEAWPADDAEEAV